MRSLLFIPGDSERKLAKAATSQADCILVDLEDAIAPDGKEEARACVVHFLAGIADRSLMPPIYVRINDLASGLAQADLDAVVPAAPDGILLPKPRSGEDVRTLSRMLDTAERKAGLPAGSLSILTLAAETPLAVLQLHSFHNCGPRLKGMTWGGEDLAVAVGARTNRDERGDYTEPFRLARNLVLYAAAAAGVQAIDTVYTDFRDHAGLERVAREAARDGFTGKLAIHPDQVPIINQVFTPTIEEIEEASEIASAFEAAPGAGVVGLHGRMLDRPHLDKARRTLERARLAGLA